MIVINLSDSKITLPTGYVIRPQQTKGIPATVVGHSENKVMLAKLQQLKKIIIKPGTSDLPEQNYEPVMVRPVRGEQSRKQSKPLNLPDEPTRMRIAYAGRPELIEYANRAKLDPERVGVMGDDDIRLLVGSVFFDDPELTRTIE